MERAIWQVAPPPGEGGTVKQLPARRGLQTLHAHVQRADGGHAADVGNQGGGQQGQLRTHGNTPHAGLAKTHFLRSPHGGFHRFHGNLRQPLRQVRLPPVRHGQRSQTVFGKHGGIGLRERITAVAAAEYDDDVVGRRRVPAAVQRGGQAV